MFDSPASVAQPPAPEDRILPWLRVRDIAGISRTTAWRLQNTGDFPRPVMLSPGRVGWRESDVRAWRASRVPRGQPAPGPLFEPCPPPPPKPPRAAKSAPSPPVGLEEPIRRRRLTPRKRSAATDQLSFDF